MPVQPKDWETSSVRLAEQATKPTTPATGYGRLYLTDGPALAFVDDTGTVHEISASDSQAIEFGIAGSDESTAIDATGVKATFRAPRAINVTGVRASLTGACTTGTFTVDIKEGGTTILSTLITIDATEKTSTTATTPPVVSDAAIADDAELTVEVTNVGDGTATGLKIWILGTRA